MPLAHLPSLDLCYDVRGRGRPVLLIMGFSAQMILWQDAFCDQLADHGMMVVRFDNRDVGHSTRFDSLGVPDVRKTLLRAMLGLPFTPPYTLEDMAEDGLELMRHLGIEQFHVVGASMGGMIAQTMAITHSERIASLTSIMSSPGGRRYSVGKPQALGALLAPPPKTAEEHVEHFVKLFRTISGEGFPFGEESLREIARATWERGPSPRGAARQFAAILHSDARRRRLLPTISAPTLVIHGTEDPLLPLRAGRATARLVPGAQMLEVPGMGHHMPVDTWPLLTGAIATHILRSEHRSGRAA